MPFLRCLVLRSSRLRRFNGLLAHWSDEAISVTGKGFNETRRIGRVTQSLPESFDRGIYAVFEIDVSTRRPEVVLQFFAGDHLAGALQEHGQYANRLAAELDSKSVLSHSRACSWNSNAPNRQIRPEAV